MHSLPIELTYYILDYIQLPKSKVRFSLIDTYHYKNIYPMTKCYIQYSHVVKEISKIKYACEEIKTLGFEGQEYSVSCRKQLSRTIFSIIHYHCLSIWKAQILPWRPKCIYSEYSNELESRGLVIGAVDLILYMGRNFDSLSQN